MTHNEKKGPALEEIVHSHVMPGQEETPLPLGNDFYLNIYLLSALSCATPRGIELFNKLEDIV